MEKSNYLIYLAWIFEPSPKKKEMTDKKMNSSKPSQPNQFAVKNSNCDQKKVNLIVPIEINNSTVDIVNSSLDFTVRNAWALGISKLDLLQMVEESYDRNSIQYKL